MNKVKRVVSLPEDLLNRFHERHRSKGALSWFLREALWNYLELLDKESQVALEEAIHHMPVRRSRSAK